MEAKVKNFALTQCLYIAGKATHSARWTFLHEIFRKFYLRFFCPLFEPYLQRISATNGFRLIPRHSIEEVGGFNVFFSDLDFTLVFKDLPSENLRSRVLQSYFKSAQRIKFLGELELYSEDEWELRKRLKSAFSDLFDSIWNLRKWHWQKNSLLESRSPYHLYKTQRSIQRVKTKLNIPFPSSFDDSSNDISDLVDPLLSRLLPFAIWNGPGTAQKLSGRSGYLGWQLSHVNPIFIALLPDGDRVCPASTQVLDSLRAIPEVGNRFAALCIFDVFLILSKKRIYGILPEEDWVAHLSHAISTYGPGLNSILGSDPHRLNRLLEGLR